MTKTTFNNKDSEKIRTSMETAMITVIGETIEEHFDDLEFIEVVRTSEECCIGYPCYYCSRDIFPTFAYGVY